MVKMRRQHGYELKASGQRDTGWRSGLQLFAFNAYIKIGKRNREVCKIGKRYQTSGTGIKGPIVPGGTVSEETPGKQEM